jgi:hypothetical protein
MSIDTTRVTVEKIDSNQYSVNLNLGFDRWTVVMVDSMEEARKAAVLIKNTVDILKHEKLLNSK